MSFYEHLLGVLKKDDRFLSEDGILLRNAAYEAAMRMDTDLIRVLLSDEATKSHFFRDIDGILVFDKVAFGWVVNNRGFLPDSYTRFKNRIGLADQRENIISSYNDVTLIFPYKDCLLEGGQTKEDQKKDERFYNYTLAPDEIDRLLSPKVLVRGARYPNRNESVIVAFENDDNLVIKGNNLLAISSLTKRFEGKIQCIYIDPPFNTGKDSFSYNDRFTRSTWLVFMKNRLEIARRLLKRDGNIFIHIDINQSHYLKILCDEIFGEDNFVEEIIWAYGSASGGRAATPKPVNIHDYILHYAKNKKERKQNRVYTPYTEKYIKEWFKYTDEDGRIYQKRQRDDSEGNVVWEKQYLDESKGIPLTTVWTDIHQVYADPRAYKRGQKADVEVIREFSGGQKPEALIKRILEMSTDPGDIVLDFHAGTGTTAATAHKMKRRYIVCEQMESQINIILSRLQKVINGERAGISKSVNWVGGGSFVYCELAKDNQRFVDAVLASSSDNELKNLLSSILNSGFISTMVNPSSIEDGIEDFSALAISAKKEFILELLDKNMLYVNLSDIDDEDYAISDTDKLFTHSFYNIGEV